MSLTKLTGLSGKPFLGDEIDKLHLEVHRKRFIQAAITMCAVVFPTTAVMVPNQSDGLKAGELLIGTLFGFASAYVAKSREEIETRYKSTVLLNRDVVKKESSNRFVKEQFMNDVSRDYNTVKTLMQTMPNVQTVAAYMQRMNIPIEYITDYLKSAQPDTDNENSNSPASTKNQLFNLGVANPEKDVLDLYVEKTSSSLIKNFASKYPDYVRLDNRWLIDLIESSTHPDLTYRTNHHFMLVGGTQSGKSTLAGVIARGIAQRSHDQAVVACHDAKKTPGKKDITRWLCRFTYKIDGYENAENWVDLLEDLATTQFEKSSESGGNVVIPELVLIQDEVNTCYGKGKGYGRKISADTAKDLQAQWMYIVNNLSGCYGHGIFMGQSPLFGDTGFSGTTSDQTCYIAVNQASVNYILDAKNRGNYLRNIPDDIVNLFSELSNILTKEKVRYCLVRPTDGNPYIAIIPKFNVEGILDGSVDSSRLENMMAMENETQEVSEDEKIIESVEEFEEPEIPQNETPPPHQENITPKKKDIQETFKHLKAWVMLCLEKHGKIPSREHIKDVWFQECGQVLSEKALDYIMEKLGIDGISQ